MNNDTKTTVLGVVKAVLLLLTIFGVNITPQASDIIVTTAVSIYAAVEVIQSWFINKEKKDV